LKEKGPEGYRIWRQTPIPVTGWQRTAVISVAEWIESGGYGYAGTNSSVAQIQRRSKGRQL